ncbi:hypothetical protein F4V43_02405 [Paenibacillus spiritus]|uniref:Uncharacterized protein n=1 Tax=Paenibacillus spiritus TaxID=2496557 RepID=A0A5J5GI47_9BACL|nr:hypothetical protein [Paenibacillus spiritus]KAA9007358.1 hypothetical protein F4V43_02405 [Paenibacillus spiritus]
MPKNKIQKNEVISATLLTDRQYKSSVINNAFTDANKDRYKSITDLALEDLTGTAEAYKAGAIDSEQEVSEQIRIFLEEYAVNLINLLTSKKEEE